MVVHLLVSGGGIGNEMGATIEITGGTFTVDGTANVLSNKGGNVTIGGTTIFNGSTVMQGEEYFQAIDNLQNGNITIDNLTVTGHCAIKNHTGAGTITINGGKFESSKYVIINEVNAGKVTINGGELYTTTDFSVIGNDGTLEIGGDAHFYSTSTTGSMLIESTAGANITISGGFIEANGARVGVQNADGTMQISGGRIISQNEDAVINRGGLTISGNAYLQSSGQSRSALYHLGGHASITGGTVTHTSSSEYAIFNDGGTISITGGNVGKYNKLS